MSVIRKKPLIETIIESLSDAEKAALVSCINATGPLTNKSLIDQSLFFEALDEGEYDISGVLLQVAPTTTLPGIVIRVADGEWFIEIGNDQKLVLYVLDTENRNIRKVDEPLNINELRTVLNDSSIKSVVSFSIDENQHLIANYNDGTSTDLGAIFSGNISISGNLTVTGSVDANIPLEKIKDANGNNRFVEGDINLDSSLPSGVTKIYGKWSLSGTHFMAVLCLSIPNGTVIPNDAYLTSFVLPSWILSKIYPLVLGIIDNKTFKAYSNSFTSQDFNARIVKGSSTLSIMKTGALTLDADRIVRISYDLLIDNA